LQSAFVRSSTSQAFTDPLPFSFVHNLWQRYIDHVYSFRGPQTAFRRARFTLRLRTTARTIRPWYAALSSDQAPVIHSHRQSCFNPISVILAIEAGRAQVLEAHAARDAVVDRLSTATRSIQEKISTIAQLQIERQDLEERMLVLQKAAIVESKRHVLISADVDKENRGANPAKRNAGGKFGGLPMQLPYTACNLKWLQSAAA
jgi:hypothetical protein